MILEVETGFRAPVIFHQSSARSQHIRNTVQHRALAYLRFSFICTISSGLTVADPTPRAVPYTSFTCLVIQSDQGMISALRIWLIYVPTAMFSAWVVIMAVEMAIVIINKRRRARFRDERPMVEHARNSALRRF